MNPFYIFTGIFLILSPVFSPGQPNISFTSSVVSGCAPLAVTFSNTSSSGVSYVWDFGDGSPLDSSINSSHIFTSAGEFSVTLSGYNGGGNLTGQYEEIISVSGSSGFFNIAADTACPNEFINFSSWDAASAYLWDFGDGTGANGNYAVHNYSDTGNFSVSLIINTQCGIDTIVQTITIDSTAIPPLPVFSMAPNPACPWENVQFLFEGIVSTQTWNFGDEFGTSNPSPVHFYMNGGNYKVTLTVFNSCGNSNSFSDSIFIDSVLIPEVPFFWFSPDSICPGNELNFNVPGDEEYYFWDFGDGDTSTEKYTSHIYDSSGFFIVSLVVTNMCEKSNYFTDTVVIDSNSLPAIPFFGANPVPSCPEDSIQFNFWENADSYQWDFGDGSFSSEQAPIHVFQNSGNYQVELTVTNACGNSNSFSKEILVDSSAIPIDPFFWIAQNPACPGDELQFDYWEYANSYYWDFGDGSFSPEQHTSHIFDTTGNYSVTLTIANGCGNSNSYTAQVLISASNVPFEGGFTWEPPQNGNYAPCEDIPFSAWGGINYQWNFGDGDSSLIKEPVHQYDTLGDYEISLIITNGCGSSDTVLKQITITGICSDTLSINKQDIFSDFKVFPNPGNGQFQINSWSQIQKIEIYNVLGEIVYEAEKVGERRILDSESVIDISKQPKGIYLLRAIAANRAIIIKLVIG